MTRTVEYIYFEAQRPMLRFGRSPYNVIRKFSFHISIDCKYIIINNVVIVDYAFKRNITIVR